MSDTFFNENKKSYEVPETNVRLAALKLLRFKVLREIERLKDKNYDPALTVDDINEVLLVAGLPVITANEVNAKEIDVIRTEVEV